MIKKTSKAEACGVAVYHDRSGVGHCWVREEELPAEVQREIEGEIVAGMVTGEITASNGQRYRW
jgi:hypothetical protein